MMAFFLLSMESIDMVFLNNDIEIMVHIFELKKRIHLNCMSEQDLSVLVVLGKMNKIFFRFLYLFHKDYLKDYLNILILQILISKICIY